MENEKKSKKGIIITLILVMTILVCAILAYTLILNKPKYIINKSVDKLFNKSEGKVEDIKTIKTNSKVKFAVNSNDATIKNLDDVINAIGLNIDLQADLEQNKLISSIGLDYKNKNEVSAQIYSEKEKVYLYLKEVFDKYIELSNSNEQQKNFTQVTGVQVDSSKAQKILAEEIKNAINEYGEITRETDNIEINGEDTKVFKNILTFSSKSFYNAVKNIVNNLKGNDEFIKCFKESPVAYLDEILKSFNKEIEDSGVIEIIIYTKGLTNKNIGVEIRLLAGTTISGLRIINEDKGNYAFTITGLVDSNKDQKGTIKIEEKKNTDIEAEGTIILTLKDISSTDISIICDYSSKINEKINEFNIHKVVKLNEVTEEDIDMIYEAIADKPLLSAIVSLISQIFNADY